MLCLFTYLARDTLHYETQVSLICRKNFLTFFRSKALLHSASPNNMRPNKILLKKSFMLKEPGAVTSSSGWTSVEVRVCSSSLLNTVRQTRRPTIFQTITSLDAPWTSTRQDIALDPVEYSRGSLGHFSTLQMERIKRLFATVGETYRWGTAINPLWAVILEKVEEVWRSAKWTETRSVFENKNVARFFLEREDTQGPTRHSGKHAVFSALVLDPIPVSRDARLSGSDRDQRTAPCWDTRRGRRAGAPV